MRSITVAVIGAGSTYTPELIQGFIDRRKLLDVRRFVFCDTDPERLEILAAMAERMLAASGMTCPVLRTADRREAVAGADYVLAQVRIGKMPARILDERIPMKYGLLGQETNGVGGMVNGLRTVPFVLRLARDMEELCPDAWLINFSNPSGMVAEAVQANSSIRMAGLCNIPFRMAREAKKMLGDPADFDYDFVGLNHLCWLTGAWAGGKERIGELLKLPAEQSGVANIPDMKYTPEELRAMGGFPCGYLNYYYHRGEMLQKCAAQEKTRGEICLELEKTLLEMYRDPAVRAKPALLEQRGGACYSEAAVSLLEAIENDTGAIHVVNVRNRGALPFLPPDAVAETRCAVRRDAITALPMRGGVSPHIVGMMQAVKAYERLAVRAALTGSFEDALAALMTHPLTCDIQKSEPALRELLAAHRRYLPAFEPYFEKEGKA